MVVKQRHHHQLAPSPRSRATPVNNIRFSSVTSNVSLPMGDGGRASPRSTLFQQSNGSGLIKRRSNILGRGSSNAFGKQLKLESPLSSHRHSSAALGSEGRDVLAESPKERQLSPTFFQQSPNSAESTPRRGRAFFGPNSSDRTSGSSSFALMNTDYLRTPRAKGGAWSSFRRGKLWAPALTFLVAFIGYRFYQSAAAELQDREAQLDKLRKDYHVLGGKILETERALNSARKSNHELEVRAARMHKDQAKLEKELAEAKKSSALGDDLLGGKSISGLAKEEVAELLKKRQLAMRNRIEALQKQIQAISRREAEERFGSGPHRVVFSVLTETYDSHMKKREIQEFFVVELAPLSTMPHSVHLFLQMVAHRLWDDTIFLHTAHHVLQAAPLTYPSGKSKREDFDKAKLAHLSFQEYSHNYPHTKYSIGFGGRPGGPDFFINTQDNSEYHGPGGQDHHDLHEEADPCFGRVVSGMDVVDRLHRRSVAIVGTKNEGWEGEDIPITTIISVRLEGDKSP